MAAWEGDFGREYTDRNLYSAEELDATYERIFGLSRTAMNSECLGSLDRGARILEIGSNVGNQLLCLQAMGFANLYGIELQKYAVELSKKRTHAINIIQGSAFDLPFRDAFFDLVFTSGVLIHIRPADLKQVLKEIHRCSGGFIWGFEYWSPEVTEINYRGHKDLLWKADFAGIYLETFQDLELADMKRYSRQGTDLVDAMFLLKKVSRGGADGPTMTVPPTSPGTAF
ncbi:MAG: methyltransferase domain-containing protein [Phycisphaerae bacterium]|nr:methyltransferase domain-containing protein [Phycisphaerae bacterium]